MITKTKLQIRASAVAAISSTLFLCACAPLTTGVNGYDNFLRESNLTLLKGSSAAVKVANCFENQANFLPLSEFSRDSVAGSFTYRLRLAGVWYEQVRIFADAEESRVEIRLSPSLSGKWKADFDKDRGAILKQCLNAPAV